MNDCIEIIVEKTEIEVETRDGEVTIDPLRHDCVSHVAVSEEHDVVIETPQQPCVEVEPKQDPCVCPDVQQTEMVIMKKDDLDADLKEIAQGVVDKSLVPVKQDISGIEDEIDTIKEDLRETKSDLLDTQSDVLQNATDILALKKDSTDIQKELLTLPKYKLTVEESGDTSEQIYHFRQIASGLDLKIRIRQNEVISDGYVEEHEEPFEYEGKTYEAGTYLVLVLAGGSDKRLYINAADLIKLYSGGETDTTSVDIRNYTIYVSIKDGSITRSMLAFGLHEVTADEMNVILDQIDAEDDG